MNRIAPYWPVLLIGLVPLTFPLQQLSAGRIPIPLVLLAMAAVVGVVTVHQLSRRRPIAARSPLLLALSLVLVSALLSTLVSADPIASIRLDGDYALGLSLVGAIALVVRTGAAARVLIAVICLVGAGVCAQGLLTAAPPEAHYGGSLVENRASGVFVQPNELGAFAALIVVLSVALLLSAGRRDPVRLLAAAALFASGAALVITLSRGAWLGLVLGLAVLLVLAPTIRRRFLAAIGVLAGVSSIAAFVPAAQSTMSIVVDRAASFVDGSRNPYDDRPQIWGEGLRQLAQHPLLGAGPGGYPVLATRTPSTVAFIGPQHAHNLLLTVAAEQGLVGVLALFGAVAVAVVAVGRAIGRLADRPDASGERVLLAGVAGALAVTLGQGLLDYPWRNAVLATMVWLLLGLLVALVAPRPVGEPARIGRPRRAPGGDGRSAARPVEPVVVAICDPRERFVGRVVTDPFAAVRSSHDR